MKKRLLALIMVLSLALSLVPVSAAGLISNPREGAETDAETQAQQQINSSSGDPLYYTYDETSKKFSESGDTAATVKNTEKGEPRVTISKEIAATGEENEFDITLTVEADEAIETSTKQPDAAIVLVIDVSTSMDQCAECGSEMETDRWGKECENRGCDSTQSRLDAAKEAAQDFLANYAGYDENGDYIDPGASRYVSIIAYSDNWYRDNGATDVVVQWTDIHRDSESSVWQQLQQINTEIASIEEHTDRGGTNIDAGLDAAETQLQSNTIKSIENKFLLLLTDGEPNGTTNDWLRDSDGYTLPNSYPNWGDYDDSEYTRPARRAMYIRDRLDTEFYSISFAAGERVSTWMNSFSDMCVTADNSEELNLAFDDIIFRLILTVDAWKVTDPMGQYINYGGVENASSHGSGAISFEDDTLTWDLRADLRSPATTIIGEDGPISGADYEPGMNCTITYTLTYRVTLDVADMVKAGVGFGTDGASQYILTNGATYLDYYLTETVNGGESYFVDNEGNEIKSGNDPMLTLYFKVPKVRGFVGNLEFTKIGSDTEEPLAGAAFKLTGTDWSATSASTGEDGKVSFTNIPSGAKYTLEETSTPKGYQPHDDIDISVDYGKVSYPDGTLQAKDNSLILVNNANTGSLTISKTVNAAEGQTAPANAEFTFTVSLTKDGNPVTGSFSYTGGIVEGSGATEPAGGTLELTADGTDTITLSAGQTVTITNIPVGTDYTVTETSAGDGFTQTAPADGAAASGAIKSETSTAAFTNTYRAKDVTLEGDDPANGKLLVKKEIDGRKWQDSDSFTFTLTGKDGAPMPDGAEDNTATITIDRSTENSTAGFGDITYTAPGTYTYEVKETGEGSDGLTYDSTVYTVAVTVQDVDGALNVTNVGYTASDDGNFNYGEAGGMTFTNTYNVSGALDGATYLKVSKTFEDWDKVPEGTAFTFTLTAPEGTPMPSNDENTVTLTQNQPTGNFGDISFTQDDIDKTYTYTITEEKGNVGGVTYSQAEYKVEVTVKANGGDLNYDVTMTQVKNDKGETVDTSATEYTATFTNTFTPATLGGSATDEDITITKNLTGRAWQEGDAFAFTIEGADELTNTAIAEGTVDLPDALTITHSSADVEEGLVASFFQNIADFFTGNDTVSYEKKGDFGTITFNEADTYTFLIKETAGTLDDITYDDSSYKVTVKVEKNEETNALTASIDKVEYQAADSNEWTESAANNIVFTNAATASENTKSVQTGTEGDPDSVDPNGSIAGVGDILTYTIHWVNNAADENGEVTAADITITDTIPTGTEYVEDSATGENATIAYDNSNRTITWTINAGAGDEGNVTFKVKVTDQAVENDGNLITNTAQIQVGDNKYDVKADTDTYVPEKDVTSYTEGDVEETGSPDSIGVGDSLTYTISYKNTEVDPATITITDVVPAGTQLTEVPAVDGAKVTMYSDAEGNTTTDTPAEAKLVKWEISNVDSGAEGTVTMTVKVVSAWEEEVENSASISIGHDNVNITVDTNTETTPIDKADRTITITPADITVYTGGDGYDGVTNNDEGIVIKSDTGLPEPGYYITLPDWLNEELNVGDDALNDDSGVTDLSEILKFFYHDEENDRTWEIERYYPDRESGTSYEVVTVDGVERGRYIYRIKPAVVNGEDIPVRVQFTPQDTPNADPILNDDFTLDLDTLYQEYDMTIYPGLLDRDSIQAQVHEDDSQPARNFIVSVGEATLTVRGTTNGEVTAPVVTDESAVSQNKETIDDDTESTITAVASEDTQYYVNDSMVSVDAGDVHLLADEVVGGNNAEEAQNILKKHIVDNDIAGEDANYVYQYLDLVDNTNGNAWVTATEDVNVYWKLPAGTDANDNFQIVHFNGLNRNYDGNNTAELIDTTGYEVETYTMDNSNSDLDLEIVDVGGEKYLKFATDSFSPFVLVYDSNDQANPTVEKTLSLVNGSAYNSGSVSVGDELTYTITVTNTGNLPLSDVTVTDTFSGVGDLTYAPSTEYSVNGDTITIPNLGVGKTVTISATYTVQRGDAGKDLTNAAAVKLPGDETPTDEDKTETPVDPITPIRPPVDPDKPELNTEDHYSYIVGYPDGNVKPEGNITRAEVATIFFRLLTDESRDEFWSQTNNYSDVSEDAWYNNAVSTLSNAGVIDGYEDGTFKPDGNITRAEFATIAVRFFEATYDGGDLFSDIAGHWAQDYINEAANAGIVDGYPDGTFRPQQYITRAEAMTMVNRTIDRHPDADHLLDDMIVWPDNPETAWYYEQVQEATNSHEYTMNTDDEQNPYEIWTELLPVRDWAQLEKEWSDAHSGQSGGDVV